MQTGMCAALRGQGWGTFQAEGGGDAQALLWEMLSPCRVPGIALAPAASVLGSWDVSM